ncbi:MAG TPA: hypothetical protein VLC93_02720 [Myxococcota bacterium]|nr:hypothetical protein [Myxococcota bacterium]
MNCFRQVIFILLLGGATACEPGLPEIPVALELQDTIHGLATPTLAVVTPPTWTAGTTVRVGGGNFLTPGAGNVRLRFVGELTDVGGARHLVDMQVDAVYRAANKVDFVFEPDPSMVGPGTFTGEVIAINEGKNGDVARSSPLATTIGVGPSILVRRLEPASQGCPHKHASGILNGELVELDIELTGINAGSAGVPIVVTVAYVDVLEQPRSLEAAITDGRSAALTIDPGMLAPTDDPEDLNDARVSRDVRLSITANNGADELRRNVGFTVREPFEVVYDGSFETLALMSPVPVTGCLPGGTWGASYDYEESFEDERERELELTTEFKVSLFIIDVGFRMKTTEVARSRSASRLVIARSVFPNWFGAFYRQAVKILRVGDIVRYDACGEANIVGEAHVIDWLWSPGFAQKQGPCPPLPPAELSELGTLLDNP